MSDTPMEEKSASKDFMGHPRGLVICFFTEMWERFSYYGMRVLLMFYLTKHFLFSDGNSASIYAAYISMVYITPVVGGIVADRFLGAGKAVMLGAVLLVAGHFGMAFEGKPSAMIITVDGQKIHVEPLLAKTMEDDEKDISKPDVKAFDKVSFSLKSGQDFTVNIAVGDKDSGRRVIQQMVMDGTTYRLHSERTLILSGDTSRAIASADYKVEETGPSALISFFTGGKKVKHLILEDNKYPLISNGEMPSSVDIDGALFAISYNKLLTLTELGQKNITKVYSQFEYVRTVEKNEFFLQVFYLSLAFIIMGVGFLKPNISSIVGSLYSRDDPRRDSGFTLFYMGINLGSFLATLLCGYLGETYGWNWGFGAAGVGMVFGLIVFHKGQHLLEGKAKPRNPAVLEDRFFGIKREHLIYLASLVGVIMCWQLMQHTTVVGTILGGTAVIMIGTIVIYAFTKLEKIDRDRMLVCTFLMLYQIIFWGLFEQTGSSLTLMIDRNVDRVLLGVEVPASLFQSFNAFFIFTLAPAFGILWIWLAKKGWEPSTPMKFAICLFQVGLGFLVMVYGASLAPSPSEVAVIWVILLFLLHTTGELCMSPVGLSMTTKLSVPKVVGMMMGVWFLCSAAGNFVSGVIAKAAGAETEGGEVVDKAAALAGYMEVYQTVGFFAIGAGIFAVLVTPICKKMMHGIH